MMKIDPQKKLTLASPHFDEMRNHLDVYISKMLRIMESKDAKASTITLKINFGLLEETITCDNSPTGMREALVPTINYKVTMTMQSKAEVSGNVVDKGHEVIQDGEVYYIVTKEEASGQLNMFNAYDELPPLGEDPDEDGV